MSDHSREGRGGNGRPGAVLSLASGNTHGAGFSREQDGVSVVTVPSLQKMVDEAAA